MTVTWLTKFSVRPSGRLLVTGPEFRQACGGMTYEMAASSSSIDDTGAAPAGSQNGVDSGRGKQKRVKNKLYDTASF